MRGAPIPQGVLAQPALSYVPNACRYLHLLCWTGDSPSSSQCRSCSEQMLSQDRRGDGLVPSSPASSGLGQARRSSVETGFFDIIPPLTSQQEPGDTPRAACIPARFCEARQICLFSTRRDEPGRQVAGTESSWSAHTRRAEGARSSAAADCNWWGDRLRVASSLGIPHARNETFHVDSFGFKCWQLNVPNKTCLWVRVIPWARSSQTYVCEIKSTCPGRASRPPRLVCFGVPSFSLPPFSVFLEVLKKCCHLPLLCRSSLVQL